ncbi:hypothetical protein ACRQ5Q_15330 [Bradyrhizobium sp. PMVTL-01]|uniref:hypothetical protein n=1 Tax=Bradyrhizobium sp. PMVTL-01 TaxID=3434999 RepID=UPI003F6F20E8
MTEQDQAKQIAEMWLDFQMNPLTQMVPGDPDCDACVLARQYVRLLEYAEAITAANTILTETYIKRDPTTSSLSRSQRGGDNG